MLSIKSLGAADSGISKYYEHLGADDYYTQGGEPPGQWDGKLASAFGLSGNVRAGQLQKLFEGCHPITGDALAHNAGPDHKSGWDCTFSAGKSISIAWAFADADMQKQIADAHDQAVKAALEYLEKNAFSSRDRSGESPLQGIIAATFQHSTSRELDPQLHTHCAIANLGLRQDGTVCAFDCDTRYKMAAGAVYRADLANRLQQLGFEIERDGKSFKLSAIPDDLCKQFSKRRQQIESYLDEHGFHDSAKAANIAALATRKAKESPDRGILQDQWQREAAEAGYSQETIKQILTPGQPKERDRPQLDIPAIISGLTQNESFFTRQQLEAAIAIECQGVCGAGEIPIIIERAIRDGLSSPELDGLVKLDGPAEQQKSRRKTEIYTTREMLLLEREALDFAERGKDDRRHVVPVDEKLLKGLSDEQANAVLHVVERPSQVACIRGLAGTGKSHMLGRARIAWENGGFDVVGAALAGKAADGLEQGSGIKSQTLHSLLSELEAGSRVLTEKSVVVLDECGMVGSFDRFE